MIHQSWKSHKTPFRRAITIMNAQFTQMHTNSPYQVEVKVYHQSEKY